MGRAGLGLTQGGDRCVLASIVVPDVVHPASRSPSDPLERSRWLATGTQTPPGGSAQALGKRTPEPGVAGSYSAGIVPLDGVEGPR